MKKKWKFGLKVADSHSEPGNLQKLEEIFMFLSFSKTRGFYHFFHFFIIFFSFSLPVAPEIQESHEKQWKTIKNKGKWKKNEVANEKKWKFGLKVADSHSEPGNLQKLEEIFIVLSFFYHFLSFFSFFFIFLARGTWNPGKQWKTMKNNGKPSKTKENEKNMKLQMKKNEVANEKNEVANEKKWR